MAGLNRVMVIGHLGRDPEIKTMGDGRKLANLNVAVSETWKDKAGERQERTEWIRVTIFSDGLASVAEKYLHKGSRVYLAGKLRTRSYEKDGERRSVTEVVLDGFSGEMIMLDQAPRSGEQPAAADNGGGRAFQDRSAVEPRRQRSNAPPAEPNFDDLDDPIPF